MRVAGVLSILMQSNSQSNRFFFQIDSFHDNSYSFDAQRSFSLLSFLYCPGFALTCRTYFWELFISMANKSTQQKKSPIQYRSGNREIKRNHNRIKPIAFVDVIPTINCHETTTESSHCLWISSVLSKKNFISIFVVAVRLFELLDSLITEMSMHGFACVLTRCEPKNVQRCELKNSNRFSCAAQVCFTSHNRSSGSADVSIHMWYSFSAFRPKIDFVREC